MLIFQSSLCMASEKWKLTSLVIKDIMFQEEGMSNKKPQTNKSTLQTQPLLWREWILRCMVEGCNISKVTPAAWHEQVSHLWLV